MHFKKFTVKNFKGISEARIDLRPGGANVFTLIGLNESGKTTVLEALDDFNREREGTEALYSTDRKTESAAFVPKHRKADFTGSISVQADIGFDPGELDPLVLQVEKEFACSINRDSIPDVVVVTRGYEFEDSDFKSQIHTWNLHNIEAREGKARKFKPVQRGHPAWDKLTTLIANRYPKIVYFPTFLFSIPSKIYLNTEGMKETPVNGLYRQIISDVAKSLERPLDIQKHLVDRVLGKNNDGALLSLFMLAPDKQQQINAALSQLSSHLTNTVFDSWSRIFSGDFTGREILLQIGVEKDASNVQRVYLTLVLRDGPTQYEIAERSLGFRWFFSFLLFTQYRVYARGNRPTLFLLDEPASNLHARAQQQLLESFSKIAQGSNQVIYSTHSQYMVNPEWLDQAFVVVNRATDEESVTDVAKLIRSKPTNVTADRYRHFVSEHPSQTTYFQPVLDALEVAPSKLDLVRPSVLVEGKGDYFFLEYGRTTILNSSSHYAIVPTNGAASMDALIGLFLGWGVEFIVVLDDDKAGKQAQARHIKDWGLPENTVLTLGDVTPRLSGKRIEGLLTDDDYTSIGIDMPSEDARKSSARLKFSELLATKRVVQLSAHFKECVQSFDEAVLKALS